MHSRLVASVTDTGCTNSCATMLRDDDSCIRYGDGIRKRKSSSHIHARHCYSLKSDLNTVLAGWLAPLKLWYSPDTKYTKSRRIGPMVSHSVLNSRKLRSLATRGSMHKAATEKCLLGLWRDFIQCQRKAKSYPLVQAAL